MQVSHTQFVEAVTPLLALCGQEPMSIFADIRITQGESGVLQTIEMVRAEDPGDGTKPISVGDEPYAALGWPLKVEVV